MNEQTFDQKRVNAAVKIHISKERAVKRAWDLGQDLIRLYDAMTTEERNEYRKRVQ